MCNQGALSSAFFVSRLCGRTLSPVAGSVVDVPVCGEGTRKRRLRLLLVFTSHSSADCTEPFQVDVVTDGGAAVAQADDRGEGDRDDKQEQMMRVNFTLL